MPFILDGTNGETFPSWTTATRPASPTAGQTGYNTTTKQMETYNGSAWTLAVNATSQGTSGQYLQSAGAGAAPTWATLSSSGALIRAPQIKTSGTSYTTPSNCTAIYVECVGGGGSGAKIGYNGAGGGSYCAKYFTVTGNTAYTYAVGAGGAAVSTTSTEGNAGGSTTFTVGGVTITAGGGGGSTRFASTNSPGAGGTATNGDLNISGQTGTNGAVQSTAPASTFLGGGGSSIWGSGAQSVFFSGTPGGGSGGINAYGYGGGGSSSTDNSGGVNLSGAGFQGVIRIWEFT